MVMLFQRNEEKGRRIHNASCDVMHHTFYSTGRYRPIDFDALELNVMRLYYPEEYMHELEQQSHLDEWFIPIRNNIYLGKVDLKWIFNVITTKALNSAHTTGAEKQNYSEGNILFNFIRKIEFRGEEKTKPIFNLIDFILK